MRCPATPEPTAADPASLASLAHQYVEQRAAAGTFAATTFPNVRWILVDLAASVGDVAPDEVQRRDVERYLNRPGLAAGTRRNRLSIIRTFWEWLILEGHATTDPTVGIPKYRQPRGLPRGLRAEESAAVLSATTAAGRYVSTSTVNLARRQLVDSRSRLIVVWMLQLGVRAVELSRLRHADIDFDERTVLVVGKGGHERLLPITEEAWAALQEHLAVTGISDGYVLRSLKKNGKLSEKPLTANWISRLVAGLMRAAGVDESGHALRHTAASDTLKAGAHLVDVQAMLGHVHLGITSRYLPLEVNGLRQAMEGRTYGQPPQSEPATVTDLPAPTVPAELVAAITAEVVPVVVEAVLRALEQRQAEAS